VFLQLSDSRDFGIRVPDAALQEISRAALKEGTTGEIVVTFAHELQRYVEADLARRAHPSEVWNSGMLTLSLVAGCLLTFIVTAGFLQRLHDARRIDRCAAQMRRVQVLLHGCADDEDFHALRQMVTPQQSKVFQDERAARKKARSASKYMLPFYPFHTHSTDDAETLQEYLQPHLVDCKPSSLAVCPVCLASLGTENSHALSLLCGHRIHSQCACTVVKRSGHAGCPVCRCHVDGTSWDGERPAKEGAADFWLTQLAAEFPDVVTPPRLDRWRGCSVSLWLDELHAGLV